MPSLEYQFQDFAHSSHISLVLSSTQFTMSKRVAEPLDTDSVPLKAGDRPVKHENDDEGEEFEDEFEDEFDSDDEILEAGVDGRPDEEREADEKRGMWLTLEALCDCLSLENRA